MLGSAAWALRDRGRLVALVTVEAELDPLASELVAAIRRSGHLFVVAGRKGAIAERLGADRRTPTARRLLPAVRTLQLEGRVVMLLATTGGAALRAADCGVGILAPPARPPWGAGLICGPGLAAAVLAGGVVASGHVPPAEGDGRARQAVVMRQADHLGHPQPQPRGPDAGEPGDRPETDRPSNLYYVSACKSCVPVVGHL